MQKRELNPATPRNLGQVNTSIAGGQNPHLVPRNFSRAINLREGLQVPCESDTYVPPPAKGPLCGTKRVMVVD